MITVCFPVESAQAPAKGCSAFKRSLALFCRLHNHGKDCWPAGCQQMFLVWWAFQAQGQCSRESMSENEDARQPTQQCSRAESSSEQPLPPSNTERIDVISLWLSSWTIMCGSLRPRVKEKNLNAVFFRATHFLELASLYWELTI